MGGRIDCDAEGARAVKEELRGLTIGMGWGDTEGEDPSE